MKKILKEIIFWEISALIVVLLLASIVTTNFHLIAFLLLLVTLTIMLGILIKKFLIYSLTIGIAYFVCGVVLTRDWLNNYLKKKLRR